MDWRKIFCFHNPTELLISWSEIYVGGQGDCSPTTVCAYRCGKCKGIYDWYIPRGEPTVRTDLIGESQGESAPDSVKDRLKKLRKLEKIIA